MVKTVSAMLLLAAAACAGWYFAGVRLDIVTVPGAAQVDVDGKSRGITDGSSGGLTVWFLPHGTHVIAVSAQNYLDASQTVTVPWFEWRRPVQFVLAAPQYNVTVLTQPPDTTVQIDGKDAGVSGPEGSLVLTNVARGEHALVAFHDGYPTWSGTMIVEGPLTFPIDLSTAAAAQEKDIGDRLQQIDQLFVQGQAAEAETQCRALLLQYPGNREILGMLQKVHGSATGTGNPEPPNAPIDLNSPGNSNVPAMGAGTSGGAGMGFGQGNGYGGNTGGLYQVGGRVSAPVAIFQPNAEFSDEARRAKYQGVCIVALIVDTQGNPQNVHVTRSLGMGLDEKAIEAVQQYKFRPALLDGRTPVPVAITIQIDFRLY
jgi:TonB family protein